MDNITIKDLYDLNETIAADVFKGCEYPWEVLPKIKNFIIDLGNKLPSNKFEKIGSARRGLFPPCAAARRIVLLFPQYMV